MYSDMLMMRDGGSEKVVTELVDASKKKVNSGRRKRTESWRWW